ncbi:25808_t:CDS:1, partial [Racocetra persica]
VFNEYLTDDEFIHVIYIEKLINEITNANETKDNNLQMEEENSLLKTKLNKSSDFTLKEIERIRKENLLLKQENKRVRNRCLLLKQENERVRNEYLLLKNKNDQTINDNKVLKTTIEQTNFINSEHSSDIIKTQRFKNKKRIFALEIERLLKKLNLINSSLAHIWRQFFKDDSNIEIIELKIKYLDKIIHYQLIPELINKLI